MIDNPFRQQLAKVAGPLIRVYKAIGVTPNMISVGSLLIAVAAALACAQGSPLGALILWWLSRLLDGTDGIYARASGQQSDFGAYLDIVCDMASYSVMILGFSYLYPQHHGIWNLILMLYVLCISSALALGSLCEKRNLAAHDNRGLRLGAGLAEGGETGIAYSLFLLVPNYIYELSLIWLGILVITVIARTTLAARILAK